MSSTLVSVITPALNPGPRLRRCLESVARQTHPAVEHIVVDGGSSDGTLGLLGESAGVSWVTEPDSGQGDALNKGFAMARGAVVGWLNADDVLAPDTAERAVRVLASGEAGAAYGDIRIVDSRVGRTRMRRAPRTITPRSFHLHNPIPQPGSFLRSAALAEVGGVDPSFALAMDFDLWLRLLDARVPFAHMGAVVASFEIHPASKTGSAGPSAFWHEMALAYRKNGREELAEMAERRGRWRATYEQIREELAAGRYPRARSLAREGARALGEAGAARTPGFGRMRALLAATSAAPRLSGAALRLIDARPRE